MATKSICDDCRFLGSESKTNNTQYYCKARKEWIHPDKINKCDKKPIGKTTTKATCKDCKNFPDDGFCKIKAKGTDEATTACNRFIKIGTPEPTEEPKEPEVPQHIKDKAKEILEKGDPVSFIFKTHQELHIGDDILSKTRIAAVGTQSCSNSKGIQPSSEGASGKGKSDGDKKFAHLLPQEYVLSGSLSDKVLYYKKDLKPGTYIFSDDVALSEDLVNTIKRATSNFQGYTPHHTLDKDRNVIENEIPPRIVWALNSVDNVSSLQLINRQFGCSVDESPEQDEKVLNYQKICGMLGIEELPVTDDVLICREIIRDIKKHFFRVVIPFNYIIEWKDSSNRRNFDMFEDMIRGFAVYRYRQRETSNDILFANTQDFDDAVALYNKRTEQQGRKLTDTELKLIKNIVSAGEADSKLLQELTGLSQGRISHLMRGKGKEDDSGLLHKVKGLHCEKRTERNEDVTATKTYYSITGFDENQYKESVVWIDDIARKEFEGYYQLITRLLLLKINNSKEVITLITNIYNIHSNKKYTSLLEFILLGKNQKTGNNGNNPDPDNEKKGNNLGNNRGNITSEIIEYIKKEYTNMKKPDDERELSYRIMSGTSDIKRQFNISSEEAHKIFKDYSKARGWE